MPDIKQLDPAHERAAATEAMETTPISGKEHEYRADGDHHPRQDAAEVQDGHTGRADGFRVAADVSAQGTPHISKGIPGAGESPETPSAPGHTPDTMAERSPRA